MTYKATSYYETSAPGIMILTIFENSSLFLIIIYFICLIHAAVQTLRGEKINGHVPLMDIRQ